MTWVFGFVFFPSQVVFSGFIRKIETTKNDNFQRDGMSSKTCRIKILIL